MIRCTQLALLFLCLALASGPLRAQTQPDTAPSPPGRLVDVGGYRLHVRCEGTGTPTVVLIAGFGDYSFDWEPVVRAVAPATRLCAYDRAGLAWSDPGPRPRSIERVADELRTLLARGGVPGPYILVGHSWGGLIARVFQARNIKSVVGMVLVDASHEDQWLGVGRSVVRPRFTTDQEWNRLAPRQADSLDPRRDLIFPRPSGAATVTPPFDRLSPEAQQWRTWAQRQPAYLLGGDWDGLWSIRSDLVAVASTRASGRRYPMGALPLVVITAGLHEEEPSATVSVEERTRQRDVNQRDLASLSSNARQIIATNSGHRIQLEEPDLVADAIRQVLDAARRKAMLCCRVNSKSR